MVNIIPTSVKKIWDVWNVRGVILLSLSLQIILILGAPFRKRTRKRLIFILIWLSYLFADWAANFAIGLISNIQANSSGSGPSDIRSDLLAFWAPFLLLHLGGPDGITAFSLEDNEFWLRHLLGFLLQASATVYVFLQTLPKNKLWIPTFLMFVAGIIKYIERTRSLYLASLDIFRESMLTKPDPGPEYAKLMDEYGAKKDAGLPIKIKTTYHDPRKKLEGDINSLKENLAEVEVVENAYSYFKVFKGLIVDLNLSFRECIESRKLFHQISPKDGLRIIEVELNFFYDVFYTKVVVIYHKTGCIFRFVSVGSVVVALARFFSMEKHGYDKFDVGISYTLLIAAIGLDAVALFLIIFSNWTRVSFKMKNSIMRTIFEKFLRSKRSRWSQGNDIVLATPLPFRRWSESVSGYNLITYCLHKPPKRFYDVIVANHYLLFICDEVHQFLRLCRKKVIDCLGVKDILDEWRYVSDKPITNKLWKFIFNELKEKSWEADDAETSERICSARGAYTLRHSNYSELMPYIEDVPFDESFLLWHVATQLCFFIEEAEDGSSRKEANDDLTEADYREFSKLLSDYMLYLLVMQPTMMSAVAGIGQTRFRDTCAEAKKFFFRRGLRPNQEKEACENILAVNTSVAPVHVKGNLSKSVLFDACRLAKELRKLEGKKWEIMSKVWMEMLCFAASHCRANTHVQAVSKGGQLITFVWLLMAHFSFTEQFKIIYPPLAKLIVDD